MKIKAGAQEKMVCREVRPNKMPGAGRWREKVRGKRKKWGGERKSNWRVKLRIVEIRD